MTSYLESKIQTGKPSDLAGKQIPVIGDRDHVLDIDVVPELDIFHFLQGQVFINSDTNLCFKIVGWVVEVAHRYSDGTPKQYAFAACKAFYSGHFFVMSKKELEAGGCHSATPQELRREWDANRENITHRYEYELKQFADRFEEFRFPKGLKMDSVLRFFEKLRDVLEDANPESKVFIEMPDGQTFSWNQIQSYRGRYDEPTITYRNEATLVAFVKAQVKSTLAGAEYSGYKGGLYAYNGYEGVVHVGEYSSNIAGAISVLDTGDILIHAVEKN